MQVEAYKPKAAHPFFDVGGTLYAEGHEHAWVVGAGTSPVSVRPFWKGAEFDVNGDTDNNTTQSHLVLNNFHPITIKIPLDAVHFQHRFTVLVSLDTVAVDDRGLESAAAARIIDSHGVAPDDSPARLVARGSTARESLARAVKRVSPKLKAPPAAPPPRPAAHGTQTPSRTTAAGTPARDGRGGQRQRAGAGHPHRRVARRHQRRAQDHRRLGALGR